MGRKALEEITTDHDCDTRHSWVDGIGNSSPEVGLQPAAPESQASAAVKGDNGTGSVDGP